ncbi:hypothetical protein ATCC90586_002932 [Pythium insidiosum]|nr:hypothetical protein ATCC90586_002932 [Pythium insidiosum]
MESPAVAMSVLEARAAEPDRITPGFFATVTAHGGNNVHASVQDSLDEDSRRQLPPVEFSRLEASDFVQWLLSLKKQDGSQLGYAAFNNHRAALFNLYREYQFTMSVNLKSELSTYFRGLKRMIAERTGNGDQRIQTGKDPLSFELYCALCETTLQMGEESEFVRTFLVVTWNLMDRSSNTVMIHHSQMEWRGDALRVYFAYMKNDQMGERPRDPRHIYANPLRPAVCPILALGIYWAAFPFDKTSSQLFPGSAQYDRFRKQLSSLLPQAPLKGLLARLGVNAQDVEAIDLMFGMVPGELRLVMEIALASLIYLYDYLESTVPSKHLLRAFARFKNHHIFASLSVNVECGLEDGSAGG